MKLKRERMQPTVVFMDETDQLSEVAVKTHVLLTPEFFGVPGESGGDRLERVAEHDVLDRAEVGSKVIRVT